MKLTMEGFELEVEDRGMAEKTTAAPDPDVHAVTQNDLGMKTLDACSSSGHVRKVTVNGRCYSQMCCGGQWYFFYKDVGNQRIWCTCDLGQSWTVNCSGNNWIINCR